MDRAYTQYSLAKRYEQPQNDANFGNRDTSLCNRYDGRAVMNLNVWRVGAVLALLIVALETPAQAQNWPTRTVKLIVPFGPGAGADIGAQFKLKSNNGFSF